MTTESTARARAWLQSFAEYSAEDMVQCLVEDPSGAMMIKAAVTAEMQREAAHAAEVERLAVAVQAEVKAHATSLAHAIAYEKRAVRGEEERDALRAQLAESTAALGEAAASLVTIATWRTVDSAVDQLWDVKGYAGSRAAVARSALTASKATP